MTVRKNERAGALPRPLEEIKRKDTEPMAAHASQGQAQFAPSWHEGKQAEGVTVTGEAVRRISPEHAEFLIEIVTSAPTAAQALRDNQLKSTQVAQALQPLGVHAADLQTISQNVVNLYTPVMQALPTYGMPQIGQPDLQFGSCHSRNVLRVNVRDAARAGEILDAAIRAGATMAGAFSFKASDEASARRATLEAAGKDARIKAETLAAAAGKQIGDAISISEELVASNGAYTTLRSAQPYAFGAGTPQVTGELEYYARVSANYRLQ